MRPSAVHEMPEIFATEPATYEAVSRATKAGSVRRIVSNIYTRNLSAPLDSYVRTNLWRIASLLFPGAVLAGRTAFEYVPTADRSVFLTATTRYDIELPGGIVLKVRKGPGALDGDRPFLGGLFVPSVARAYLENMVASRAVKGTSRTLSRNEIELRLENDLVRQGEDYLNALRDKAREIAPALSL